MQHNRKCAKSELGEIESKEGLEGGEYQMEMMKLLRDVNIDSNCVGWYQSMYLGTVATSEVVSYQYNYQMSEELSENSIVLAYDAVQSTNGNLVVKAFRLSDEYIKAKRNKVNKFMKPDDILEELPIRIKNGGLISAFLRDVSDASEVSTHFNHLSSASALNTCQYTALSMTNSEVYLERQLDLVRLWIDDLVDLQQTFQTHAKYTMKARLDHIRFLNKRVQDNLIRRENGEDELPVTTAPVLSSTGAVIVDGLKPIPEAPPRADILLTLKQLSNYCNQINSHVETNYKNLYMSSQLCGVTSSSTTE